ncbi:MAG: hypothetical protein IT363_11875 [Methanoregulaceae archaeon]|nr:hypothetical protein [Methanoregulaceae archaeon]
MIATTLLLTLALAGGERIHPRDEGVNLVFNPSRFAYRHEYKFENLKEEAKSVYFLLPRNCQEHTITAFSYTVAGKALEYKVVSETPGWQVARAEVPPSRNFSVIMVVRGVHWNGKLSRERSTLPEDIAPPPISDEKMKWYAHPSPFLSRVQPQLNEFLKNEGIANLGDDFVPAFSKVYAVMMRKFRYGEAGPNIEELLAKGFGNCNGLNRFVSAAFDLSPGYVGVDMNGIVMEGAGIHAMSLVGKQGWRYLVPTDAVKFDNNNPDPTYLSGHTPGWAMLLFQEGIGDPAVDPKGGVVFHVQEAKRNNRAPNPGGMMWAFAGTGEKLFYNGGKKAAFTQTPITDFDALRRELAAAQRGTR